MVHKGRRWRLNIKVKKGPSQREAVIKHVLELFIYKTERNFFGFERWLSLSTTGNGVLTIFHTKMSKVLSERLALLCSFIKLGTPPHLFPFTNHG
jgi:hypothetical protein